MVNTVVLGSTGTGKTEKAKEILSKAKIGFVFDYQNSGDWDFLPLYNEKIFQEKCRITKSMGYDYNEFIDIVEKQYFGIGATIILEESKGLFPSNQLDQKVNDFLLSCRHNKINFVFLFHGASQVPPFILEFTDIVVVKRIDGNEEMLKKKFNPDVYNASMQCKEDIRKTFVIGVSNKTMGLYHMDYFKGDTIMDRILKGEV